MYRIEPIEKPLEEYTSLFDSPAIIKNNDYNAGKRNPHHTSQRINEIDFQFPKF